MLRIILPSNHLSSISRSCSCIGVKRRFSGGNGGTTIDQMEVDKFTRQSSQWWDANGPFQLLHSMNIKRVLYMRRMLRSPSSRVPFKGIRHLDVGCGGGLLTEVTRIFEAKFTFFDIFFFFSRWPSWELM